MNQLAMKAAAESFLHISLITLHEDMARHRLVSSTRRAYIKYTTSLCQARNKLILSINMINYIVRAIYLS